MEVHQHTHTERKKWHHYFWEFFMLFLAVTLGFLVENQREHFVEHQREKKYIRAMIEDLKTDTIYYAAEIALRKANRKMVDTLIHLLSQEKRNEEERQHIYYLARVCIAQIALPQIHDRTYEQMKSSGNLRLISRENISDSISDYYFNAKEFQVNTNQTMMRLLSTIEMEGKVFDGMVFQQLMNMDDFTFKDPNGNPSLITDDKKIINEMIVRFHYLISISAYTEHFFKDLNNQATHLISFLQKKYLLE